jgi:hypothetical protein
MIVFTMRPKMTIKISDSSFEEYKKYEHFKMDLVGPWQICRSITALVEDFATKEIIGLRKAHTITDAGYGNDGIISYKGKRRSVFTSSCLFENSKGELLDCAVLVMRSEKKKE